MPTNKSIELEYLGRSSEYDITRFNNEKNLAKYKNYVFWMTFISYMSFHLSRKGIYYPCLLTHAYLLMLTHSWLLTHAYSLMLTYSCLLTHPHSCLLTHAYSLMLTYSSSLMLTYSCLLTHAYLLMLTHAYLLILTHSLTHSFILFTSILCFSGV